MASFDWIKSSNFTFDFAIPKKFTFFIQDGGIPGFSLGQIDIPHVSQRFPRPGDNITFNPLSLTLLVDEDLQSYLELYKMLIEMKNPETAQIQEWDKSTFTGILAITTNKNNIHYIITFYDCWVSSVTDLIFSTTNEDQPLTFNIDIYYSYFKIEKE